MTNPSDEWMTIREAALALKLSELTVRRRIKDGRLIHRLINGKYYVNLNAPERPPRSSAATAGSVGPEAISKAADKPAITQNYPNDLRFDQSYDQSKSHRRTSRDPVLDLNALLAEHGRLSSAAGRAAFMEDRLRDLEERNRALHEGLVSLANRNGWLESKLEERERHIKLLTDRGPRRPWWRRVFNVREAGA